MSRVGLLLCKIGLHTRPAVYESERWPWPITFTCARCGGTFVDDGPAH